MISRPRLVPLAFASWTIFVWGIVRLRNILTDPALDGAGRVVPLLLSASFWIPAVVLILALFKSARARSMPSPAVEMGLVALAGWSIVVWVYKAVDIALLSDHAIGFVAVHTVLALISIGLAVPVSVTSLRRLGRTSENGPALEPKAGVPGNSGAR